MCRVQLGHPGLNTRNTKLDQYGTVSRFKSTPLPRLSEFDRYQRDLVRLRWAQLTYVPEDYRSVARIFSWKQTDSVNAELLDRHHQALFNVVRELYDALSRAAAL